MIIGLSGYARSGKDTVADYLVEQHGFKKIAFAKLLKDSIYTLNPIVSSVPHSYDTVIRYQDVVDRIGLDKAKEQYPEVRRLLQIFGTEVGRELLGQNIWVDTAMNLVKNSEDNWVFTDVRFSNEFEAIKSAGGNVWRVERDSVKPVNAHVSETALDDYLFDYTFYNNQTIKDLQESVNLALTDETAKWYNNILPTNEKGNND